MQGVKARAVVEGGVLATFLVLIAFLGMYVPDVRWVGALPVVLMSARHGVRYGMMTAVAGALVSGLLVNVMTGLFLFLGSGLVGVALGECFRRGVSAVRSLMVSTVVSMLSTVVALGTAMVVLQMDIAQLSAQLTDGIPQMVEGLGQLLGASEAEQQELTAIGEMVARVFLFLVPSCLILGCLLKVLVNFLLAGIIMERLGMKFDEDAVSFPSFDSWSFSPWVLYFFVLAMVGLYWGNKWEHELLLMVAGNVQLITGILLFVQGASFLRYIADQNAVLQKVWWVLIVLALIFPVFTIVVLVAGGIDMLLDYFDR